MERPSPIAAGRTAGTSAAILALLLAIVVAAWLPLSAFGQEPGHQPGEESAETSTSIQERKPQGRVRGSWTPITGPSLFFHSAVLQNDGKVLVSGGCPRFDDRGYCRQAETATQIYDPAAKKWSAGTKMNQPRAAHTSTVLPDGKVLVAGGFATLSPVQKQFELTADLFDPESGKWTSVPPLSDQHPAGSGSSYLTHHAVKMPGDSPSVCGNSCGKVVLVGHGTYAQSFDPATRKWHALAVRNSLPRGQAVALLRNSDIFTVGYEAQDIYDPRADQWKQATDAAIDRGYASATTLPDGKVLVAGGLVKSGLEVTPTAEIFDPAGKEATTPDKIGIWNLTEPLAQARFSHTATRLDDGKVLVTGGSGPTGERGFPPPSIRLATAELYDHSTGHWSPAGSMPTPRGGLSPSGMNSFYHTPEHTTTVLKDGRVLVVGGSEKLTADIYTPEGVAVEAAEKRKTAPMLQRLNKPAVWAVLGLAALLATVTLVARK